MSDLSTESGRRAYCQDMLERLCSAGPRPAGSPAYNQSAALVETAMEQAGLRVERSPFSFSEWALIGQPWFRCGGRDLETLPDYGSSPTPVEGISGRLECIESDLYRVCTENGPGAYVYLSPFGRATPLAAAFRPDRSLPIFNLGRQDRRRLDQAVRSGTRIEAQLQSRVTAGRSHSVIGTLPGRSKKEILFLAHGDTQYNSPGAHDNTATLIVLFLLAHAFAGRKTVYTLSFAVTGGEEIGLLGARAYARDRLIREDLKSIEVCVNLDSLTYGPNFVLTSSDEELKAILRDCCVEVGADQPRLEGRGPLWDGVPFAAAGVRTVYINSRGYDEETLPLWHRPEDLPATVRPELIENAFQILKLFIEKLSHQSG